MSAIKRSRTRTTKWNLFFHYFTAVYAIISGIVLVPLYLHYIALDVYGAWLAASNIIGWLSIVDPGLSNVVMQRVGVAYGEQNDQALNGLITNGLLMSCGIATVILLVGLLLSPFIFAILNLAPSSEMQSLQSAFMIAVAGTALMVVSYGFTAVNQGLQSSLGIGLIFAVTSLASLGFTAWLLFKGMGVLALPLALAFRGVGLCVGNAGYLFWRLRIERMNYKVSFQGGRELFSLMSYTFWGKAVGGIAGNLDALVITRYLGPEAAPVLLLTRKAPELSRTFLERPAVAFMPAIAHLFGGGDLDRSRAVLLRLIRMIVWLLGLSVAGFLLLNEAFVGLWVGKDLYAGTAINSVIVLGLVVSVLTATLSNLCYALGNIKGNSIALLLQSLIGIPLMFAGVYFFGMMGVALAPIIATMCVSSWYYPRAFSNLLNISREENLDILIEIAVTTAATISIGVGFYWIAPETWPEFAFYAIGISVAYAGVLLLISKSFRQEMATFFAKKFGLE